MTRPDPDLPTQGPDLAEFLRQVLAGLFEPTTALERWLDRMEQTR